MEQNILKFNDNKKESTKVSVIIPVYNAKDYLNFLKGLDSQINHEKISYLGYQRKPSKITKR